MRSLFRSIVLVLLVAARLEAASKINGKIAFHSIRDGNNEIYVMNQDGTGQTRLTFDPASDSLASWSPDGKKIVFLHNTDIFVMNADGTAETNLTNGVGSNGGPEFSPDGTKIAFHSARGGANFDIYVMNADGTNVQQLTTNPAGDFTPTWSPDGQRIAFRSNRDGNNEIYVMNAADGSGQTNLTNDPADDQDPDFSPDGLWLVVTKSNPNSNHQIVIMNANGGNPVQLTSVGRNSCAVFSPDGTKIAFTSDRDGNLEIYTMSLSGASQTRLTNNAALDHVAAWQPGFLKATIGVYRPSTGQWLLRNTNTPGQADIKFTFGGIAGDLPVAGDWDGDGRTDVGIFRSGTFFLGVLKTSLVCNLTCGFVTTVQPFDSFSFGQSGDRPVAGDWDGDGVDEVGVFRDVNGTDGSAFLLRERQGATFVTTTHLFGSPGDLPIAGDWIGTGRDGIGVFHNGIFLLSSDLFEVNATSTFGFAGDRPMAGDWTGENAHRLGLFHPATSTMSLETQLGNGPDITFTFGQPGDLPVAGHWQVVTP